VADKNKKSGSGATSKTVKHESKRKTKRTSIGNSTNTKSHSKGGGVGGSTKSKIYKKPNVGQG